MRIASSSARTGGPSPSITRSFGRGETIFDAWHYVPVLARKPGALRNGAPFKDWVLPAALDRVRRKLAGSDDGDRQMVKVLAAVLTDGLPAVEGSLCAGAGRGRPFRRCHSQRSCAPPRPGAGGSRLRPRRRSCSSHAPIADCARYDAIRST